ncbi:MAG: hypothetical protein IJ555_05035 [Ruminococcus sp.]|nr:hypothetical protein [Ruminococcus sp.]
MNKESKALNTAFRLIVFITFVMTSVSISVFLYYVLKMNTSKSGNKLEDTAFLLDKLSLTFKMYDYILVALIICLIASLATRYRATMISYITRNILLIFTLFRQFKGRTAPAAFLKFLGYLEKANIDYYGMTDRELENALLDSGIKQAELDRLDGLITEGNLNATLLAAVTAMVVLFLLSLTSMHSLLKKDLLADNENVYHVNLDAGGNDFHKYYESGENQTFNDDDF